MGDENQVPANFTSCCGAMPYLQDVWLWVRRAPPYTGSGRRLIGDVICCTKCLRPRGELKILPAAPPEFNASVWREMLKKPAGDRYYCEFVGGNLVPYGGKKPLNDQIQVGQSFVAQAADGLEKIEA